MKLTTRAFLFITLMLLTSIVGLTWETVMQQPVSAAVAVGQLEDSAVNAAAMRSYSVLRNSVSGAMLIGLVGFGWVLFRTEIKSVFKFGERE